MAISTVSKSEGLNASAARTRVKICGITRPEDAALAVSLGADAIGLVFYPKSPRCVTLAQASSIIQTIPAFVSSVGLFVDQPAEAIQQVLDELPLTLLQFHGNESAEFCQSFQRPYIKALRIHQGKVMMSSELFGRQQDEAQAAVKALNPSSAAETPVKAYPISDVLAHYADATGFLFDTYKPGAPGGTGDSFDWAEIPARLNCPVILAGGLCAENVANAISVLAPFAVDVSSGVELEPGIKSPQRMRAFFSALAP